jgi:hypothetical protein
MIVAEDGGGEGVLFMHLDMADRLSPDKRLSLNRGRQI